MWVPPGCKLVRFRQSRQVGRNVIAPLYRTRARFAQGIRDTCSPPCLAIATSARSCLTDPSVIAGREFHRARAGGDRLVVLDECREVEDGEGELGEGLAAVGADPDVAVAMMADVAGITGHVPL